MARSLAHRETLKAVAAATAAWAVLVAGLFGLVPGPARGPAVRLRTVASHPSLRTPVWESAPQVYAELDRRVRGLGPEQRAHVARAILEEAARAGVAPLLVLAVIHVESRFDPRAVSPVGAVGLMQVMVPTFRAELAGSSRVDPFDPVANVRAGVRYLGRMVGTFSNVELALVAYNAGPGAVRRHLQAGGVPERLRAYPRDVLRAAVRLWPAEAVSPGVPARALAAAHAPAPAAPPVPGALVARGGSHAGPRAAGLAAPGAGAPVPAGVQLAVATPPLAADGVGEPPRQAPRCRACVPDELGLPMARGHDPTAGCTAQAA